MAALRSGSSEILGRYSDDSAGANAGRGGGRAAAAAPAEGPADPVFQFEVDGRTFRLVDGGSDLCLQVQTKAEVADAFPEGWQGAHHRLLHGWSAGGLAGPELFFGEERGPSSSPPSLRLREERLAAWQRQLLGEGGCERCGSVQMQRPEPDRLRLRGGDGRDAGGDRQLVGTLSELSRQ